MHRGWPYLSALTSGLFLALAVWEGIDRNWVLATAWGAACLCFAIATVLEWKRARSARAGRPSDDIQGST